MGFLKKRGSLILLTASLLAICIFAVIILLLKDSVFEPNPQEISPSEEISEEMLTELTGEENGRPQLEAILPESVSSEPILSEEGQVETISRSTMSVEEQASEEKVIDEDIPEEEDSQPSETQEAHICSYIEEVTAADCLGEGMIKRTCHVCGIVGETQILSPLGHDFKKSVWESATCRKGGYYNNICQRCGMVECVTVEALPHETEAVVIQEGNCMEDTIIRNICRSCGEQIGSDSRYTPRIHEWITGIVDGMELTYCTRCGVAQ